MACNDTPVDTYVPFNESTPPTGSNYTALPTPLRILLAILMVIMIAIGFLGNAIVCLIVYQKPAMRSAINLLLATLAFSDIMLSLFCMPFTAVTIVTVNWNFGAHFCRISAMLYWLFVLEGVAILLIISVDRFLIIVQRQDKLNPHRAKVMIAISWLLSFCISFPSVVGRSFVEVPTRAPQCVLGYTEFPADRAYAVMLVVAVFFIPFSIMLYSYLCILNTVRRNALRIHNHAESLCLSQVSKLGLMGLQKPHQMNVDVSFKTRAFTTILILFIGFSLCWLPHTVFSLLSVFSRQFYYSPSFYVTSTYILWLSYLKSVFNPVIYCWRIKKFREACMEFMPKTFKVLPKVPGRTKRRIQPSTIYVCSENQSAV
ncbi:probable G-protein coupled receptor 45 [Alligator mississippiensis]|uniref:probable G-protein coupled receptor 45 n=1 Tax=Alligator mississippiensis TaxID=8496 RepID=UPI0003D0FFE1|nr:probable G-protein coupled receptor 45 [Alligator mississippiensis]XP_059577007.1 probable G-protein coupled receptor 45 [Alligator mississippiensis]XP_059577008.1 probable G-protein coupled receptor 45 [Alligator mississippiensis]XP_059577009.1 probable G-protein coupled receptor 45 [Alligator mississippiensis]